ncbi:MAG: CHRD domain-containing protein [Phycisphaerales bacterium]
MRQYVSILGACCGVALAAAALAQTGPVFSITMNGAQEVPPVPTPATGTGMATLNTATNQIMLMYQFSGLSSPQTAAHIHQAPAGTNGPVIVPLPNGSPVSGTFQLTAAQAAALLNNGLYINVHTQNFPGGEIRGQILITGACCVGTVCQQLTAAQCQAAGGVFNGPGSLCSQVNCSPAPVINGFTPPQGHVGDIITIVGSGFGNNPDNICCVVPNGPNLIPLDVLTADDTVITARLGPVPPTATPGPIMLMLGDGTRGPFRPAFFDVFVEVPLDTWAWRGTGQPAATTPNNFVPLPLPDPPNTRYVYGEVVNGRLCLFLEGDWPPNKKLVMWNRLHGVQNGVPFFFHDLRTCVRFRTGGSVVECADRLCDTIRCAFGQQNPPVTVECQIQPLPDGRVKVTVGIPNGTINSGTFSICIEMPDMDGLSPPVPPILVSAFGHAQIDPLSLGLLVSNIGSSGQDGVSFDLPNVPGIGLNLDTDPLNLDVPGRCLNLRAWGPWNNSGHWPLGDAALWGRPESCLDANADFMSVGSPTVRIDVFNGSQMVASFVRPNGNVGVVQGPPGGIVPPIGGCGKLPPFPLPCFFFDFDQPFFFTPSGSTQPVMGTSLRLLANQATAPINEIELFDVFGVNPDGVPPQPIRFRGGNYIPGPNPCPCDWNHDGVVGSQDFFDFIVSFFAGQGDINGDGATTSQDFFDFLVCFFSPPPGC